MVVLSIAYRERCEPSGAGFCDYISIHVDTEFGIGRVLVIHERGHVGGGRQIENESNPEMVAMWSRIRSEDLSARDNISEILYF